MTDVTDLLICGLLASTACACTIACGLRSPRLRELLADRPNERSLHTRVTPRFGGLSLVLGTVLALTPTLISGGKRLDCLAPWLTLCLVVAAFCSLDDRRPLSPALRLILQLLVAALWVGFALTEALPSSTTSPTWHGPVPLVGATILVLGLTWSMNLYNFMDGADGLAGSMAVIGFGTYAIAAWQGLDGLSPVDRPAGEALLLASLALAAASAGFLIHNLPPARVFMGDAGSVSLGFSAGALGLSGVGIGLWSPVWPAIVFFPFIFDASLTLANRLLRGEAVWRPHREHLYQRYILGGHTHRQMLARLLGIMLGCATLALLVGPGVASFSRNFAIWIETLIIALQIVAGFAIARRIGR